MDEQEDKPKRVRRTKAQMEAARAEAERAAQQEVIGVLRAISPMETPFLPRTETGMARFAEWQHETLADAPGIHVRTLKDIQMPREYLLDYFDVRDPKLAKGAIIYMKREWADLLIVAGKVERV